MTIWGAVTETLHWGRLVGSADFEAALVVVGRYYVLGEDVRAHAREQRDARLRECKGVKAPDVAEEVFPTGKSLQAQCRAVIKQEGCTNLANAKVAATQLDQLFAVAFYNHLAALSDTDPHAQALLLAAAAAVDAGADAAGLLHSDKDAAIKFRGLPGCARHLNRMRAAITTTSTVQVVEGQAPTVQDLVYVVDTLVAAARPPVTSPPLAAVVVAALGTLSHALGQTRAGGVVAAAAVEVPNLNHVYLDVARLALIESVARGTCFANTPPEADKKALDYTPNKAFHHPATAKGAAVRERLLQRVFHGGEVERMAADGGHVISFTSDGVDLNAKVAHPTAPRTRTPTHGVPAPYSDALAACCAMAGPLVGDPLAGEPFFRWGAVVSAESAGDFMTLDEARRLHIGDLVLLALRICPHQARAYKEDDLRPPLEFYDNSCPDDFVDDHCWLIASLATFDTRFSFAIDAGATKPVCAVNVGEFARRHADLTARALTRRAAAAAAAASGTSATTSATTATTATTAIATTAAPGERLRFTTLPIRTCPRKRDDGEVRRCVRLDRAALRAVVKNGTVVVRCRYDATFGPWVMAPPAGTTLPEGVQVGDQLLEIGGVRCVGDTAEAASALLEAALQVVNKDLAVFELRLFRPRDAATAMAAADAAMAAAAAAAAAAAEEESGAPTTQGAAASPPPPPPPVALTLTRAAVMEAKDRATATELARAEGRTLWCDKGDHYMAAQQAKLAALEQAVKDFPADTATSLARNKQREVVRVQLSVRAVRDAKADVFTALAGPALPDAPLGPSLRALGIALDAMEDVKAVYFDPRRVAAERESRRRCARVVDRAVEETVRFLRPPPGRPGLVVVGDWVKDKTRRGGGSFAMAEYLEKLARRAIVVIADEFRTSQLCPFCGSRLAHPRKFNKHGEAVEDAGTVYCPAPRGGCVTMGRFAARDVSAAAAILRRFLYANLIGGQLGACLAGAFCLVWVCFVWR